MANELRAKPLPCPFCREAILDDSEETFYFNGPGPPPCYAVRCGSCGAQGPYGDGRERGDNWGAKAEAIKRWNELLRSEIKSIEKPEKDSISAAVDEISSLITRIEAKGEVSHWVDILPALRDAVEILQRRLRTHSTAVLHEGVRQSYLKACELSLASGMLGDGDRSDLLELYNSLWPSASTDIREQALIDPLRCSLCGSTGHSHLHCYATSSKRLDTIKQTPRQASIDDIEWLCDEVERLQTQLLEVNNSLGLDRDNQDNILRVTTALRLRAGISRDTKP
jgi:hypothetical protein